MAHFGQDYSIRYKMENKVNEKEYRNKPLMEEQKVNKRKIKNNSKNIARIWFYGTKNEWFNCSFGWYCQGNWGYRVNESNV